MTIDSNDVTFAQAGTGAVARTVRDRLREAVSVRDFGAVGDGSTDDYPAFRAALDHLRSLNINQAGTYYIGSPKLFVPAGKYRLSQTLDIDFTVTIEGESSGLYGGDASVLVFDASRTGLRLQAYNTTGATGVKSAGSSDRDASGTVLRGLGIGSAGGSGACHGLHSKVRFIGEDLKIAGFPGNGINIVASTAGGSPDEGNANCWVLSRGRIAGCGGSGLYIRGADTNAGVCTAFDVGSNGGWGVEDRSFLGNTFVGCHAEANTLGAYRTTDPNGQSVFLGCYSELGQPSSSFGSRTLVLGGTHGAGATGGALVRAQLGSLHSAGILAGDNANSASVQLGGGLTPVSIHHAAYAPGGFGFKFDSEGNLKCLYNNLDSALPFVITGPNTTNPVGPYMLSLPAVGIGWGANSRLHSTINAMSDLSGATLSRGTVFYYANPSAGGKLGCVVTTSGLYGSTAVVKEFGAVDA